MGQADLGSKKFQLTEIQLIRLTKEFERKRCNEYFIAAAPEYDNTIVNLVKLSSYTQSNQSYIVMKSMGQADLGTEKSRLTERQFIRLIILLYLITLYA